jgi:hypothetical protein
MATLARAREVLPAHSREGAAMLQTSAYNQGMR